MVKMALNNNKKRDKIIFVNLCYVIRPFRFYVQEYSIPTYNEYCINAFRIV